MERAQSALIFRNPNQITTKNCYFPNFRYFFHAHAHGLAANLHQNETKGVLLGGKFQRATLSFVRHARRGGNYEVHTQLESLHSKSMTTKFH